MLLLIFESIGMSELILIGIVALIIFGPRKLPQMARKAGKTMTDLRKVTNEFKKTWQNEVDISELQELEADKPVPKNTSPSVSESPETIEMPNVSSAPSDSMEAHRLPESKDVAPQNESSASESTEHKSIPGGKGEWF